MKPYPLSQSTLGRALRDTGYALHTKRFWAAELIALALSSALAVTVAPSSWTDSTTAWFSAGIALSTAGVLVLVILMGSSIVAPYRQRNEARELLFGGDAFQIRPISGEWLKTERDDEMYAQLSVRNNGDFLKKCSVRLESLDSIVAKGVILTERLQPRPLQWSSRETSAHGEFKEFLDIPNDGREHFIDVAAVAMTELKHFTIISANYNDRPSFGQGWYKVGISISSESEKPNPKRVELLLGLHYRGKSFPAPLELHNWEPRGVKLLELLSQLPNPNTEDPQN